MILNDECQAVARVLKASEDWEVQRVREDRLRELSCARDELEEEWVRRVELREFWKERGG